MIVVGASLGGVKALGIFLSGLRKDFPQPIAIVAHRAKDMDDILSEVLQARTTLRVTEVVDKDPFENGVIYLGPADYHLLIDRGCFSLSVEPPVNHARPSIDVLFESAAEILGPEIIAVVLTGSSADGAAGVAAVASRGGRIIVQEPATAESPTMPMAALGRVPNADVVPLSAIAPFLNKLTRTKN